MIDLSDTIYEAIKIIRDHLPVISKVNINNWIVLPDQNIYIYFS
jgi:hypothetical protein